MRPGRAAATALAAVSLLAAACGPLPPPGTIGPPPQPTPTAAAPSRAAPESADPGRPSGSGAVPTSGPVTPGPAAPVPATGSWARVDVAGEGPPAREDHTWTVDGDGRLAYLFGGRRGATSLGDLWTFDLAALTWRQVDPGGSSEAPAVRFGHEAQWVPGLGLVIFAGQAGSTFFDDLWLYSPATDAWTPLPSSAGTPVPRYGTCSGVGPDGRLWMSHGFTADGARFSDTRSYDFVAGRWLSETPLSGAVPVERCLHACWWTADGRFTLYGGQTTGVPALGDLWRLTAGPGDGPTNTWSQRPEPALPARQLPAVARGGPWTLLVGGRGSDGQPLGDAWVLADTTDRFAELALDDGDAPSARSGAALIHDAARDRFLLFGGIDDEARDDLWSLATQ